MKNIARILLSGRQELLGAGDLPQLCRLASKLRGASALICVASFLVALAVIIGYRAMPFTLVPPTMGILFGIFVLSAMSASRFGRLTDAKKNIEYANRIGHMVSINPFCAEYEQTVLQQHRPFTRLDLDELGAIHINTWPQVKK
ncbi:MAG TPA: hypothetical protein PL131_06945 [Methylotenera sp.]|nr:hypothetical protein [Methylotenera sp.]HPH05596.1 hypothetical protein [Methylotenera sp.]HPM99989.1 hypothetical protein [Methylotenera sp.]